MDYYTFKNDCQFLLLAEDLSVEAIKQVNAFEVERVTKWFDLENRLDYPSLDQLKMIFNHFNLSSSKLMFLATKLLFEQCLIEKYPKKPFEGQHINLLYAGFQKSDRYAALIQFFKKGEIRSEYDLKFIEFLISNRLLHGNLFDPSLVSLIAKKDDEDAEENLFQKKIEYLTVNNEYIDLLMIQEESRLEKEHQTMLFFTTFGESFEDLTRRKIELDKLNRIVEIKKEANDISLEAIEKRVDAEFKDQLQEELDKIREWQRINQLRSPAFNVVPPEYVREYKKDKRTFYKQIHPDTLSYKSASKRVQTLMDSTFQRLEIPSKHEIANHHIEMDRFYAIRDDFFQELELLQLDDEWVDRHYFIVPGETTKGKLTFLKDLIFSLKKKIKALEDAIDRLMETYKGFSSLLENDDYEHHIREQKAALEKNIERVRNELTLIF